MRDATEGLVPGVTAPSEGVAIPPGFGRLWLPVGLAVAVVAALLLAVVAASPSAWRLLGAGRGVVPEAYYPVSGFVLVLATALGQAAGWAGGSAFLYYVMTRVGFPSSWTTGRVAMSVVYVGLAGLPLLVYHALYDEWLLGLPRTGLVEWLRANHPDAHWLLVTAHPVVDLSLIPLGIAFLWTLWRGDREAPLGLARLTVLALTLLGTSLALALSLAIHSTLVHVRL